MKVFKFFSLMLIISVVLFSNSVSLGFAYFNNLNSNNGVSALVCGTWVVPVNYFGDFENFTNTTTGQVTVTIGSEDWDATNLILADNATTDNINDTKSGRISGGTGQNTMTSVNYFINLQTISLYIGLAPSSPTQGARKYEIQVSDNGVDWAVLHNDVGTPSVFSFVTIDMAAEIAGGLVIGSTTVTTSTPLQIRIYTNSKDTTLYNVDDITIITA